MGNWLIGIVAKLLVAFCRRYLNIELGAYSLGAEHAAENLKNIQNSRVEKANDYQEEVAAASDNDLDDLLRSPSRRL